MDINLSELLSTQFLSKNTTSIIIGYLTDPPKLPYLDHLVKITFMIYSDTNIRYSYQNYYITINSKSYHKCDSRYHRGVKGYWYVY